MGSGAREASPDQVNLVLQDDDVLQAHDLHCSQMLTGLRLRARLVCSNEQQRAVHHSGSIEHGSHENVMPCTCTQHIDTVCGPFLAHLCGHDVISLQRPGSDNEFEVRRSANVTPYYQSRRARCYGLRLKARHRVKPTWAIDEGDMPDQLHLCVLVPRGVASRRVLLAAAICLVASRPAVLELLTLCAKALHTEHCYSMQYQTGSARQGMVCGVPWHAGVLGLVDLGIRIAQLDGDVALKLVLEADSLDATDGFHHR